MWLTSAQREKQFDERRSAKQRYNTLQANVLSELVQVVMKEKANWNGV